MKKRIGLITLLLFVLTACVPHNIGLRTDLRPDLSGTIQITMRVEDYFEIQGEDRSLESIKNEIQDIIATTNRIDPVHTHWSIEDDALIYVFEQSFDNKEGFEAIVTKLSGEEKVLEVNVLGTPLNGETYILGFGIGPEPLVGWIYDEIEARGYSKEIRKYAKFTQQLTFIGEEVDPNEPIVLFTNPKIDSIFLDIFPKEDGEIDTELKVVAASSELTKKVLEDTVRQFEERSSAHQLGKDQSFDISVGILNDVSTITLYTKNIQGDLLEAILFDLLEFEMDVQVVQRDNSELLDLSVRREASNHAVSDQNVDIRTHLGDFEIVEVNGNKIMEGETLPFSVDDSTITNIENGTIITLSKQRFNNPMVYVVLVGIVAVALGIFLVRVQKETNKKGKTD